MRAWFQAAVLAAGVMASGSALADRLDDLMERMARLERENGQLRARLQVVEGRPGRARLPQAAPRTRAVEPSSQFPTSEESPQQPYTGGYVAAGIGGLFGGQQVGQPVSDFQSPFTLSNGTATQIRSNHLNPSFSIIGGYGIQTSEGLYGGVEARFSADNDRRSGNLLTYNNSYMLVGNNYQQFRYLGENTTTRVSKPFSADFSGRIGFVQADTLWFVKAGAGAATLTGRTDDVYYTSQNSLGVPQTIASRYRINSDAVTPYLLAGVGMEKQLTQNLFVRGDVELINYVGSFNQFASNGTIKIPAFYFNPYYEGKASLLVGYRW